jgi:hypothetical protein
LPSNDRIFVTDSLQEYTLTQEKAAEVSIGQAIWEDPFIDGETIQLPMQNYIAPEVAKYL